MTGSGQLALRVECTPGWCASWCPNCGDCTCPRGEDGFFESHFEGGMVRERDSGLVYFDPYRTRVLHHDDGCPLHGAGSRHNLTFV